MTSIRFALFSTFGFFWGLLLSGCSQNQCLKNVPNEYNQVLLKNLNANQPGASVAVVKGKQIVFQKGYGLANVGKHLPITPQTTFRIGSLSKSFTAAAIMLLAERNQLSLKKDIQHYLPNYPNSTGFNHAGTKNKITLENLLSHTSGLPNYTDFSDFETQMSQPTSLKDLIATFKNKPLDFTPGSQFAYSNSNYILLAAIIEQISGQPYCNYMQQHIFKPLGMENTRCNVDQDNKMAVGYSRNDKASPISWTQVQGAGSLISNTHDLILWNQAIRSQQLLSAESWQRIFTPFQLNNGETTELGFGWGFGAIEKHSAVGHEGTINGFSSMMIRLPEDDIFVVALMNDDRLNLFSQMESWFYPKGAACLSAQLAMVALKKTPKNP